MSVAIPELEGALRVRVVTGTQVFGLGCRQRTEHDACSADGKSTYTWVEDRPGARRPLTLTSARMHRNAEHTAWVVALSSRVPTGASYAGRRGVRRDRAATPW